MYACWVCPCLCGSRGGACLPHQACHSQPVVSHALSFFPPGRRQAYDLAQLQGRRAAQFLALVEPAAAGLPYLVAPGNHEHAWNLSHYR